MNGDRTFRASIMKIATRVLNSPIGPILLYFLSLPPFSSPHSPWVECQARPPDR
jgi:hypothetical protein